MKRILRTVLKKSKQIGYFARCAFSFPIQSRKCPHCASEQLRSLATKFLINRLLECLQCGLRFRFPQDPPPVSHRYYQDKYHAEITTDLPTDLELAEHKATHFTQLKDIRNRIVLLKEFRVSGDLLDFGCSWGYHSWQLREAGYSVTGYEISHSRASYGKEKLGLNIIEEESKLLSCEAAFDILFSSHTLEHVNNIGRVFHLLARVLRPGGLMMIFVPNGDPEYERRIGKRSFGERWGQDTPLMFSGRFLLDCFKALGYSVLITSYNWQDPPKSREIVARFQTQGIYGPLWEDELLVLAEKK